MDETLATVCMMMYVAFAATAVVVFDQEDNEEEEEDQKERKLLMAKGLQLMRQLSKRRERLLEEEEANNPVAKKPKIKYDYERARSCVYQDYLGPDPLFERYFERVFRVSRSTNKPVLRVLRSVCHAPGVNTVQHVLRRTRVLVFDSKSSLLHTTTS
jgi:phosphomannomutase